jgi:hypothetical protein
MASYDFADLTHRRDNVWGETDEGLLEVFEHAFVDKEDVLHGDQVEDFWNQFASYSKTMNLSDCDAGCTVVVRKVFSNSIQSLAYCFITAVRGVAGAPENCQDVVVYSNGKIFILAPMSLYNFVAHDGEGGDEIKCTTKGPPSSTKRAALAEGISDALQALKGYVQERKLIEQDQEILLVNRFNQSAFVPPFFEISTIRFNIYEEGGNDTVIISPTIVVSGVKSDDPEDYHLVSMRQANIMRTRLLELMPKTPNCKVSRGL